MKVEGVHRSGEPGDEGLRGDEARQTLDAIRNGEVDAVVVSGKRGPQVYTLEGPDRPFRIFVESMEQGAISLAADETILYCNGFLSDLLKVPLERVIGQKLERFVAPEEGGAYRELIRKSRSSSAGGVVQFLASDGERIPVSLNLTRLGSEPPTWCVIAAELRAEQQAREAQLAREKAEAANAAKDELLALVSHELRTPLDSILGWAQILLRRAPEDPEFRKGLESIERNARAQQRLIADLVDSARIATGKLRLECQPVGIDEVVRAAVSAAAPAARLASVNLGTDFGSGEAAVFGDPSRLQQIVSNLVTNAIKYTPSGGSVEVSTRRCGDFVELRVRDDGEGISAELLPKVFESFTQGDSKLGRPRLGLGLGLAIVKSLAEMHGGSVEAFSEGADRGATFTVRFPVHMGPDAGDAAAAAP